MADVQSIIPFVWTSEAGDAGTDSDVYLGIGGREFYLDTKRNDFEPGDAANATVGVNSQVKYPDMNDPRTPYKLRSQDLNLFPVYLRLDGSDHWKVSIALVQVYSGASAASMSISDYFYADVSYAGGQGGLWLGPHAGKVLHLRRGGTAEVSKMLKAAKLYDAVMKRAPGSRPARRRK